MSAYDVGHLLGSLLSSVFGLVILVSFLIGAFFLPFLAWSAARNIKLIRRELERLNETLSSRSGPVGSGPLGL